MASIEYREGVFFAANNIVQVAGSEFGTAQKVRIGPSPFVCPLGNGRFSIHLDPIQEGEFGEVVEGSEIKN